MAYWKRESRVAELIRLGRTRMRLSLLPFYIVNTTRNCALPLNIRA